MRNSKALFDWIKAARINGPDAQKTMKITLLDEAQRPVQSWLLRGVIPMGMLLSLPMIALGAWLIRRALEQPKLASA